MIRIDAHQHFWHPARGDYFWLTPDMPIARAYAPADLLPHLLQCGIAGSVLVQAAPTVEETQYLLGIADATPFVLGVVGWIDFAAPEQRRVLERFASHPKLVGIRPMIQDLPDDAWMLRADVAWAFAALAELGLVFDALVLPRHLANLRRLLDRHAGLTVVIDHAAKPPIRAREFDAWAALMRTLAAETAAFCKLSGLVTEAAADWTQGDLKPYVDHLLETFGPHRLIFGSDWPVATLATSYERWVETVEALLGGLAPAEREAVFGGNAARVYGLQAAA